ncbi:Extradiol aromatic ring-opening dioxygenase [Basidiobolus meristosporus CBS 931.73]|uniref:Extradiol aromatic ring-opening dioxygenase n=1 Tax=Basidiobolus meristosporus CBS 931.73 TaxID=1314790 RepID=A0A1Y1Y4U4_9FUNG|nr:Extradiol aromatic ring-opening dioxygenase [Basidiobolus meristosporus CBS 931.73]|eukprot:ORX93003.1 Extradiol aromatic ring-opening dioxygenase [Basidiobolus meristosporus CBS 931.73]
MVSASSNATEGKRLPVVYISHGGPNLVFEDTKPSRDLQKLGNKLSKLEPKAVVVFSAHWETRDNVAVQTSNVNSLIYDFYGFPKHYYQVTYDSKGDANVSRRVLELLKQGGIEAVEEKKRGIDHGVWVPFTKMFPTPNFPIVQVSLKDRGSMEEHIKIGAALAALRDEGVLLIGSGSAVHNLRDLGRYMNGMPPNFVVQFDKDLEHMCCNLQGVERENALCSLKSHPILRNAHPSIEHLIPVHIVAGAAGNDKGVRVIDAMPFSTITWSAFAFGL